MVTYAITGATGRTGGSIVEILQARSEVTVRAIVRSKQKLLDQRPSLAKSPNVEIFEGGIDNVSLLASAISGTQAVFLAAGASDNIPGLQVSQQQVKAVVAAVSQLREQDPAMKLPLIVVLSSASIEYQYVKDIPKAAKAILYRAAYFVYKDLEIAESYLRGQDWLPQVYVRPGGLVHDVPHGHVLSTERQETFISFLDLAAGMVEVAEAGGDVWDQRSVSVVPATSGTKIEWTLPWIMAKGLLYYYLPFLYPYTSSWLP